MLSLDAAPDPTDVFVVNEGWQPGAQPGPAVDDPDVETRVRGLLLGLAVGEVAGRGIAPSGTLRHGVASQLACFTAAAGIRTSLRRSVTGAADARADLLDAYRRWARVWTGGAASARTSAAWIDDVPLLGQSTGEAQDTVRGLAVAGGGTRVDPVTTADGWHALARALPLAVQVRRDATQAAQTAVDSVALTHGPRAFAPTALGVLIAGSALQTGDLVSAVAQGISSAILEGVDFAAVAVVDDAVRAARETPASPVVLRSGAGDESSAATLWGATYCVLSHPEERSAGAALSLAAAAPFPGAVSAVTGAFLGAAHGDSALPQAVLTRLDLAYVIDRLARDLAREHRVNADGTWGAASDPAWRARYGID